jgi:membrane-bound metal-dependent hydrolase YbcI (DUF457 family)
VLAVGHMALAYLLGKPTAKALKVNVNVPLLMVLSILPDIDILFENYGVVHRGPTHSVIAALLVFIPIFYAYRKKAAPYLVALLSHSLIGDFFIGGQIQLFWPLSNSEFGLHELGLPYFFDIDSSVNVALELTLFILAIIVLFKSGDIKQFFLKKKTGLLLIIPIGTVLVPSVIGYPMQVPSLLIAPHLFFLILFSVTVFIVLASVFRSRKQQSKS